MTQLLDQASDFWISQGGQDPISQGWKDMAEGGSKFEEGLRDRDERSQDLDEAVNAAAAESRGREDDRSDWDSSREHREWLAERYPDTKLADYGRGMLDWHEAFKKDPAGAREAYIRTWAKQPPFHHRSKPKESPAQVRPVERIGNLRPDDYADDAAAAYQQVIGDAREKDDFASTAELRQLVKEKLPGISFSKFMEHCRAIDQASLDDPHGVANRFALFSGMPATEHEAAEMHQGAQHQALVADLDAGYARVVQSGLLPGAGTPEVDDAIVAVLQDPRFQRTGDYGIDLQTAHHYALQLLATRRQETANKESAERARNASRSVSGAPSPGATSPQPRNRAGNSVDDDVRAAYYSTHARA
jgi:hypothetical protein